MDDRQRQIVLFLGFTVLLIAVMVFLLAQGDIGVDPTKGIENSTAVKGSGEAVNDSVTGWNQLYRDATGFLDVFF